MVSKVNFLVYAIHHSEHESVCSQVTNVSVYKNTLDYIMNHFHCSILSSGPQTECNNILSVAGLNASSFRNRNRQEHTVFWSSRNMDSSHDFLPWAADGNDPNPWVELELSDRSTVAGKNVQICV